MPKLKNILLINPWIYDFAAYDLWMRPLGLLYLGAILKKNRLQVSAVNCLNYQLGDGCSKAIIKQPRRKENGTGKYPREIVPKPPELAGIRRHFCRYGIPPACFHEELGRIPRPDLIFVTSLMTYWYPGVFEAIKLTRLVYPGVPIVLGGNYVTLCPEHARKAGADELIRGEGERHLQRLISDYLGLDLDFLPNFDNLDTYPYPALELIKPLEYIPLRTSRGCPYRCTYCATWKLNPGFSQRTPENVFEEIVFWNKNFGIKNFTFYDDAFLVNKEHMALPLLATIKKSGLNCQFHCPNGLHLREITPQLARLLFETGFSTVRFGFESSDCQRQRATGGKVTNEELQVALAYLKEAGYKQTDLGVYILTGLPGQSGEEVEETIRYVLACGGKPIIAEYSPLPGTELWEEAVASSPYDLLHEPLFHNNTILPCQNPRLDYNTYRFLRRLTQNGNGTAKQ